MSNLAQKLADTLIELGLAQRDQVVGCSESEMTQLEKELSIRLPGTYKEFLSVMGKSGGAFESDSLWTLSNLKHAQRKAQEIIEAGEDRVDEDDDELDDEEPGEDEDGEDEDEDEDDLAGTRFELPQGSLVFLAGDYSFYYFETDQGDDPPVYLFEEGDTTHRDMMPSFSDWLEFEIEECLRTTKRVDGARKA